MVKLKLPLEFTFQRAFGPFEMKIGPWNFLSSDTLKR